MSLEVNTYTPSDVILIFGGYRAEGWDRITISRSVEAFRPVKGIRGKHTRIRDLDTSATIVLSVMQTSPTNDYLSGILEEDFIQGTGRLEITLKDSSGESRFSSVEAYITGFPETTYAEDIEYRSWNIFCQTTDSYHLSGNEKPSNDLIREALRLFN